MLTNGSGEQVLHALGQLCEALEGIDERRAATEVAPLQELLALTTCPLNEFVERFDGLKRALAPVG